MPQLYGAPEPGPPPPCPASFVLPTPILPVPRNCLFPSTSCSLVFPALSLPYSSVLPVPRTSLYPCPPYSSVLLTPNSPVFQSSLTPMALLPLSGLLSAPGTGPAEELGAGPREEPRQLCHRWPRASGPWKHPVPTCGRLDFLFLFCLLSGLWVTLIGTRASS